MRKFGGRWIKTLFIMLMLISVFGIGGCSVGFSKTVTSVESVTLSLNWFGGASDYEITNRDGEVEIKYFNDEYYEDEGFVSEIKQTATCDEEKFIELMNNSKVMKWDGFHGEHPMGVMDGTSFSFTAVVNDGHKIYADGSQNFPDGYNEFFVGLHTILDEMGETVPPKETTVPEEVVTSMDFAVLSLSRDDGASWFDIDNKGDEIEVKYYEGEYYEDKGNASEHKKTVICDAEEFIELMNRCKVMGWDGFYSDSTYEGYNAITYEFSSIVNDGQTINFYGVDSVPEGYEDFYHELCRMLDGEGVSE